MIRSKWNNRPRSFSQASSVDSGLEERWQGMRSAAPILAQEALMAVQTTTPESQDFLTLLRQILSLLGVPDEILTAGLEELAAELEILAPAA